LNRTLILDKREKRLQ